MTDTGTTAPHQEYPQIKPAPRSHETSGDWVPDTRVSAAPDQTYPQVVPAPKHVETTCPTCGKPR